MQSHKEKDRNPVDHQLDKSKADARDFITGIEIYGKRLCLGAPNKLGHIHKYRGKPDGHQQGRYAGSPSQKPESEKLNNGSRACRKNKRRDKADPKRTLPAGNNRIRHIRPQHKNFSVGERDKPQCTNYKGKSYRYKGVGTALGQSIEHLLQEHRFSLKAALKN
jgi:hypothetical protein